ncbi:MAG: FAD-dependent oxidoreductase, partial [Clostridia bacterium]|nr:FAD-dependent oxidoreductase [Clostridia bacterium]
EALPVAGGMMAVGIPSYRLPKDVLNFEIENIKKAGVEIRLNTAVGKDISMDELRSQYNAVFISAGAHSEQKLGVPGEDLAGVVSGVSFLRVLNLGSSMRLDGQRVAVVGGGNVAIDAARSSLRLGAKEVTILYRRSKEDMPAIAQEVEEAEKEGIKIMTMVNPVEIRGQNGRVSEVICRQMRPGDFDESGRRRPLPVEGSEFPVPVDLLIVAIGQVVDAAFAPQDLAMDRGGTIKADPKTMATNIPGVFAGGDCVSGPATVIEAVAAGKRAARAIDKYLGGDGLIAEPLKVERKITGEIIEKEKARIDLSSLPVSERITNFSEVEQGYTAEVAREEASRCLRCDVKSL